MKVVRFFTWPIALMVTMSIALSVQADEKRYRAPESVFPRDGLENRIQFWKDIFGKYSKDQLVFHYRDYPWIIYSVLDFRELNDQFSGRDLVEAKKRATEAETRRIEVALKSLAAGREPESQLEQHIVDIFRQISGGRSKYLLALGEDQVRNQSGVREQFIEGVRRSGRYLYAIETVFAREGLPVELTRLPLVESSFNYNAYSSVGAAGIWQFMKASGDRYMIINSAIDERRDPFASSRAAASYLKHSYDVLGSWPVAITSYNHGLNGMVRATRETGSTSMHAIIQRYMGDGFGFASQNFYCEFLAALEVEKNYREYFPGLEKEAPWYVDEIRMERAHRLPELLQMTGLNKEDFLSHNLALLDPIAKGRASIPGGFMVKVPRGHGSYAINRMSSRETLAHNTSEQNKSERQELASNSPVVKQQSDEATRLFSSSYTVKKGDSVFGLAKRYNVSVHDLMAANDMTSPSSLRSGRSIKVPQAARAQLKTPEKKSDAANVSPSQATASEPTPKPEQSTVPAASDKKQYTIQKGDTIISIAKKTGVPAKKLQEINKLSNNKIKPGQKLTLN